ncbi:MAG: D-2-hydroxyacid dehydrogenase [Halieaceae bacterium]|nr:D-2-hydroxyacid dehydrogenase [Halieaceae bacterium]
MNRICIVLALLLVSFNVYSESPELPEMLQGLGLREHRVASRDLPGWKPPTRVVVRNVFDEDAAAALKVVAPGVDIVGVSTLEEARAAIPGAQVLIGYCDQGVFDAANALHWVQVYFAGVENCVGLPAFTDDKLLLTNGQRLGSPTLADHTIALMMAQTRGLATYIASQQRGQWEPNWDQPPPPFGEVAGQTMLVVGLGGIGTQVARRAHGLGMRVIATRNSRREGPDFVDYVGLADEVWTLARQADVVVNAAPLTDSTRGLFDTKFFKAMKPTAYFISVGRGKSTVTADLIKALESGQIAGAALDVTDPEPLPAGHPLWTAPNLIITPHVAGRSSEGLARIRALVAENLRRYVAGEPLLSTVNVKKGY